MTTRRVAAIVVTYNRRTVLAETLRAVYEQTRPPDRVYVVDNASTDGTDYLLRSGFPDVIDLRMAENTGFPGGLARGIETAWSQGFDAFWLLDDDSTPTPAALQTLLAMRGGRGDDPGIVGCRGGVIRFGLIRHLDDPRVRADRAVGSALPSVDFVLLDGSLVMRGVVDVIGVPRSDFFMMLEDVEYSLRATRARFSVLVTDNDLLRRRHLGSNPGSALWRSYYQARNHVRMALDLRSPRLMFGCTARQVRAFTAAFRAPNRRWERVRLRSRGVWDGLVGRMGRTVEPGPWSR
jgi:rhamnopyranosyl-N-acetylglucosaminyl-diphospho-decaprenol beta-1,3/1,4-galactofuranosyltransferase